MNQDLQNRSSVGKRAGIVGILCNAALCVGKLIAGSSVGSASIVADGLNNLADSASSVVTLLGFRFAEKPADSRHPCGHARYEYLVSLIISMLILAIGFELAAGSVKKILNPAAVELSLAAAVMLAFSVAAKLAMMLWYRRAGRRIGSDALLAAAADCRNDAVATGAVLAAAVAERFTGLMLDGVMGLLVAMFILFSGASLAKETISRLLGEAPDPAMQKQITDYIESCPMVIGCHDLMVHDYGPGRRYASIHVEMDGSTDPLLCHDMIDRMERACKDRFGVHMVIHYDPVQADDPEVSRLKELIAALLKVRDERLEIHDFRILPGKDAPRLVFDVTMPESLFGQQEDVRASLGQALLRLEKKAFILDVTFDLQ